MPCGEKAAPGAAVQAASPHGGSSEALNCGSRVMVSLPVSNSAKEPGRRPSAAAHLADQQRAPVGQQFHVLGTAEAAGRIHPARGHAAVDGRELLAATAEQRERDQQRGGGAHGLISLPWLAPLW
jgi:hypothetical protein